MMNLVNISELTLSVDVNHTHVIIIDTSANFHLGNSKRNDREGTFMRAYSVPKITLLALFTLQIMAIIMNLLSIC